MTFRQLNQYLSRMEANQLDSDIIVETNGDFFRVDDLRIADGNGDFLYKGEHFFTTDEQLSEKDFDEEE